MYSKEIGYTRASIYQWRKRYFKEGKANSSEDVTLSSQEMAEIKSQMMDMQMEIDLLQLYLNTAREGSFCRIGLSGTV